MRLFVIERVINVERGTVVIGRLDDAEFASVHIGDNVECRRPQGGAMQMTIAGVPSGGDSFRLDTIEVLLRNLDQKLELAPGDEVWAVRKH